MVRTGVVSRVVFEPDVVAGDVILVPVPILVAEPVPVPVLVPAPAPMPVPALVPAPAPIPVPLVLAPVPVLALGFMNGAVVAPVPVPVFGAAIVVPVPMELPVTGGVIRLPTLGIPVIILVPKPVAGFIGVPGSVIRPLLVAPPPSILLPTGAGGETTLLAASVNVGKVSVTSTEIKMRGISFFIEDIQSCYKV